MKSKYIAGTVLSGMFMVDTAVVFPETLDHSAVARKMGFEEISSAGFVSLSTDGDKIDVSLYGSSVSLRKDSDSKDVPLVREALGIRFSTMD